MDTFDNGYQTTPDCQSARFKTGVQRITFWGCLSKIRLRSGLIHPQLTLSSRTPETELDFETLPKNSKFQSPFSPFLVFYSSSGVDVSSEPLLITCLDVIVLCVRRILPR
ncbi:hypothetical protein AVEN_63103-1 [Araneus ventricosus]|uniref:Uncharacterized protein n=1 Tax=Araneus ventricosus TaxID=182803 RepID=A0A4Y2SCW0_ARAVE|nr:hypothetical protein AVEN_63103-1 [Araneus ventricosus]